ncbi:hypothetical protein SAMN05444162_2561 [Paenibacillaceae bacterium GAS479]|nr:hypothetical protein SAMN05444162_2561 [Paenibacillaceae bacterium GAS479]
MNERVSEDARRRSFSAAELAGLRHPERFAEAAMYMASLPERLRYNQEELLAPPLLMQSSGTLEMYYTPHNELGGGRARLVIAGLTPGWRQMEISLRVLKQTLASGCTPEEACRESKRQARFAGSMRTGLLDMLRELGLPELLRKTAKQPHRLGNAAQAPNQAPNQALCQEKSGHACDESSSAEAITLLLSPALPDDLLDHPMIHTTSVLPCPVFRDGTNYSGHQPPISRNPFLLETAVRHMTDELNQLEQPPLLVPLGKAVEDVLRVLQERGLMREEQVLWGFPHPSGANGHRHAQFREAFPELKERLERFMISLEN